MAFIKNFTEWNGTATLSCISQIIQEHTLDNSRHRTFDKI